MEKNLKKLKDVLLGNIVIAFSESALFKNGICLFLLNEKTKETYSVNLYGAEVDTLEWDIEKIYDELSEESNE